MVSTDISHMEETVFVETPGEAQQTQISADARLREGKLLYMKQREGFILLFVKRVRKKQGIAQHTCNCKLTQLRNLTLYGLRENPGIYLDTVGFRGSNFVIYI